MAWIEIIHEDRAEGLLAQIYRAAVKRAEKVFNILKVQSQNAAALETSLDMYRTLMFGSSPLTRAQRELMAVVVSRANHCHY